MRAVKVSRPGGVEQLEYIEVEDPVAGPTDVVVQVRAAAVNHADIWLRNGELGPLPLIPGIDGAGTVAATGPDVVRTEIGDRVLLNPAVTCGVCDHCLEGAHGLCPEKSSIGQKRDGTYAEYVKVPQENVHSIPDGLPFEEAAAVPTAFFTSFHLVVSRAEVRPGDSVLVLAAGGGVGNASVQLANLSGGHVFAAASSTRKLALASDAGAREGINYAQEDLEQRVMALTNGRGVDVVIDPVGASTWPLLLACLRRGARLVHCGYVGGRTIEVDIPSIMSRQISLLGSGPQGSKIEVARVIELLHEGRIRGAVDQIYPLAEAGKAQAAMEARDVAGKLLLRP